MIKPRVLVFAGSIRRDSLHRKLATAAVEPLQQAGFDVTVVDLREFPMPFYDGDLESAQGLPVAAAAFKRLVREHDALVIASPEYNGSFPALIKNTIDWVSRPAAGEAHLAAFRGKSAALLSASPGPRGGERSLRHLRELLTMIGVNVVPAQLAVSKALSAFDADGALVRAEDRETLARIADELAVAAAHRQAA